MNTRMELALLGQPQTRAEFDRFRARFTGTPLTRARKVFPPKKRWGQSVGDVLRRVRAHNSADSASYYYKQYWQYFDDLHRSLRELAKVLKPDGIAVLVLQNSYYKEIHLDLPKLISSMASGLGIDTAFASHNHLERVMTSINSRSQKYSIDRKYAETALVLVRK
jgi:SAM-dependent methyltransferase